MPYFSDHLKKTFTRILEYPLTLIEADSGCGKSTAIHAYFLPVVAKGYYQYIYTSLGESAKESWKGFCYLLSNVDAQTGHYLESMGVPDENTMSEAAYQISNMACNESVVLCLDNFQLMDFPERWRLLQALSLHRCPHLHFVVLTQPLKESGQSLSFFSSGIFRIGTETLLFSREDIRNFFQEERIQVSRNNLDQVWEITEGLAAAVSLQLESWKHNGRFEPSEKISDLMETALWNHLNAHEQSCLVRLSVLNSFTLRQALFIDNGRMDYLQMERLFRKTHFLRFDRTRQSYHFHFLLRTFLDKKLNLLEKEEQAKILRLAAQSCAAEGNYIQSAIFYGRIKDFDALLSVLFSTHNWVELISLEKGKILEELISPQYCDKLLQYPELALLFCFELYIRGNVTLHKQYLNAVQLMIKNKTHYDVYRHQRLLGEYALIQSFFVFNDIEKMGAYHRAAASLLHNTTRLLAKHGCWTFGSPSIVSLFWREPGKLYDELQSMQNSMPAYYSLTNGNGSGAPEAMAAEIQLLHGAETKSSALFRQTIYKAEQFEQDCICYCARFGMARLALLQGNYTSFAYMREKINDLAYEGRDSSRVFTTTLCEGYFHMMLGEYNEISEWICNEDTLKQKIFVFALPFVHILKGRLLLWKYLKGKITSEEFEEVIAGYIQECTSVSMLLPKVYYKIYLTIYLESAGKTKESADMLREILSLVTPDKVWLPLAEHYDLLRPLINKMTTRREEVPALEIIEALGKRYRMGIKKIQQQLHPHNTPLTPREKEVAVLLKQRYSVKEISEKLQIASSTVSNTMQKIYSKLGIHSKRELYAREDI